MKSIESVEYYTACAIGEALSHLRFQSGIGISYSIPWLESFYLTTPMHEAVTGTIGQQHIYMRSLIELEKEAPGVGELLVKEHGKTVFVGNGLSPVPEGGIINDRFDYFEVSNDIDRIIHTLEDQKLPIFARLKEYKRCATILTERLKSGQLRQVNYTIGSGNPPEELRHANLIISIQGPPMSTLDELYSLLAPGGTLLITTYFGVPEYATSRRMVTPVFDRMDIPVAAKIVKPKTET